MQLGSLKREKQDFQDGVVAWKVALRAQDLAQLGVERFDDICSVQYLSNFLRIGEKRHDLGPPRAPQPDDDGMLRAPALLEGIETCRGGLLGIGAVDRA